HNLNGPKLFKVITPAELIEKGMAACAGEASFDDLMLWIDDVESPTNQRLLSLPVGDLLLPAGTAPARGFPCTQLFDPQDAQVVQPGDVIVATPWSRMVRVLYRRGSNSNLLFMTDRCNSMCLMCSQPPKDIDDIWHV